MVAGIFGMRFYHTQKYGWGEKDAPALHDYSTYPDSFNGGSVEHFKKGMSNGFHLMPDDPIDAEPIVVFGGSGGSSNFELAKQIAEKGYEVYSLFYFGAANQPKTLNKIPLEFFRISWTLPILGAKRSQ